MIRPHTQAGHPATGRIARRGPAGQRHQPIIGHPGGQARGGNRQDDPRRAISLSKRDPPNVAGVYLSTMSEPFDKILRYGQALTFFDNDAIGASIFFDDLGEAVNRDGLPGVIDQIDLLLKDQQPSYVVIDSFKALRAFAADEAQFRRFLHDTRRSPDGGRGFVVMDRSNTTEARPPTLRSSRSLTRSSHSTSIAPPSVSCACCRSSNYAAVVFIPVNTHIESVPMGSTCSHGLPTRSKPRCTHSALGASLPGIPALDETIGDGYWPGAVDPHRRPRPAPARP